MDQVDSWFIHTAIHERQDGASISLRRSLSTPGRELCAAIRTALKQRLNIFVALFAANPTRYSYSWNSLFSSTAIGVLLWPRESTGIARSAGGSSSAICTYS